jgi:hypothetical protein
MAHRRINATAALLLSGLLTVAAGCSHLPHPHWPWQSRPEAPPEVVHEVLITTAAGAEAAYPQYWKGNTLVVDLRLGGAQGSAILKPREHSYWPVRIAFRVLPGQFAVLEVQAKQRAVLPITTAGRKPVDLELAAGVYIMKSPRIAVSWGPADQSSGS